MKNYLGYTYFLNLIFIFLPSVRQSVHYCDLLCLYQKRLFFSKIYNYVRI